MPIPNLIHPVPIQIQRINSAVTTFDLRSRSPVRQMWKRGQGPGTGTLSALSAQVNWNDGHQKRPRPHPGGVEEKSLGYLLFRLVDLIDASVATLDADGAVNIGLARGDKIIRIGVRKVNLFVLWFRDVAFYPDQLGSTLLEADFSDRRPGVPKLQVT